MAQIATVLHDEAFRDQIRISKGGAKDDLRLHSNLNQEFSVLSGSDGESDSEEIEIFELRKRMWKDQMLLNKLEGTSKKAAKQSEQCTNTCRCSLVRQLQPSRKTELRAEDGVLHYMLKMMRHCDARGFVYGILPNTGSPITGSSDSLRAWWNDTVAFDRNAPPAVVSLEAVLPVFEESLISNLYKLQDMNDNTIGSILSALIQHCEPPQRSCPLDRGMAPPWWPTGKETWWGLQGQAHAQLGPPPYRKPHDLRKGWKLSLLAAVIKHMSPRFDDMRSLVWQSKRLQHKISAKEADTWLRVLNQEQVLVEETKRSLVISPLENSGGGGRGGGDSTNYVRDDMTDTRKRKWGFGTENWFEGNGNSFPNEEVNQLLYNKLEMAPKMDAEQSVQHTDRFQCHVSDGGSDDGDRGGSYTRDSANYVRDRTTNTDTRAANGEGGSEEGFSSGDLWPNLELDFNSINQLMMFYPQECLNADLGSII